MPFDPGPSLLTCTQCCTGVACRWQERFQDPPPLEYMLSYRQRVATCLDIDFINRKASAFTFHMVCVHQVHSSKAL